ncbi:MAG: TIGR03618 family F420-dependent PPOX class oxidoreductase [Ktedonobacterales bacterium]
MKPEERDALLAQPLDAIVAVNRRARAPQLTPVWFYWDGAAFYLSTTRDRTKYTTITRDPLISLIVNDQAAQHYITAYGRAEIVEGDAERVLALTMPIMEKYAPGQYITTTASLAEQGRVVIVLRPERIVSR